MGNFPWTETDNFLKLIFNFVAAQVWHLYCKSEFYQRWFKWKCEKRKKPDPCMLCNCSTVPQTCPQFFNHIAQKIKFSNKDFVGKWDQIRSFLRIWSHLLKKSLMENFIFCAVSMLVAVLILFCFLWYRSWYWRRWAAEWVLLLLGWLR